jgi:hypothetical protein
MDGDARVPGQTTGAEDGIELREPRPDDPLVQGDRNRCRRIRRERDRGQRSDH